MTGWGILLHTIFIGWRRAQSSHIWLTHTVLMSACCLAPNALVHCSLCPSTALKLSLDWYCKWDFTKQYPGGGCSARLGETLVTFPILNMRKTLCKQRPKYDMEMKFKTLVTQNCLQDRLSIGPLPPVAIIRFFRTPGYCQNLVLRTPWLMR